MPEKNRKDRDELFILLLKSELGNLQAVKEESKKKNGRVSAAVDIKITLLRHLIETYENEKKIFE